MWEPKGLINFLSCFGLKVVSLQSDSLCGKKEEEELGEEEPAYTALNLELFCPSKY